MSLRPRWVVAFIVLFGFFARAATFKSPLLDHHAWRQADTAAIARNFVTERFNPLYPQVDWRGAQPTGYVETGFELLAVIVAAISSVTGFHQEIGRIASSLAFVASALLAWTFVRRRYGDMAGLSAAFMYAFGFPLALYMERAFMNEALLIALALGCLVAAQRYLATSRAGWWALIVLLSTLIAITKPTFLVVWAPVAGLFVEARGWRAWRSAALWIMVVTGAAAAALWFRHVHALAATSQLSFGLANKVFNLELAFSWDFVTKIARRLFRDVLCPVGLVAAAAGLWRAGRERRWCEILGALGFVAYLVAVADGNFAHDYYQLALMPLASILVGAGFGLWYERLSAGAGGTARATNVVALLLMAAALSTFVRLSSFHSWFFYNPPDIEFCDAAAALGAPADRVIVMAPEGDPKWLFCMNRKGWLFDEREAIDFRIKAAWHDGARYAFVARSMQSAEPADSAAQIGTELPIPGPFRVFQLK